MRCPNSCGTVSDAWVSETYHVPAFARPVVGGGTTWTGLASAPEPATISMVISIDWFVPSRTALKRFHCRLTCANHAPGGAAPAKRTFAITWMSLARISHAYLRAVAAAGVREAVGVAADLLEPLALAPSRRPRPVRSRRAPPTSAGPRSRSPGVSPGRRVLERHGRRPRVVAPLPVVRDRRHAVGVAPDVELLLELPDAGAAHDARPCPPAMWRVVPAIGAARLVAPARLATCCSTGAPPSIRTPPPGEAVSSLVQVAASTVPLTVMCCPAWNALTNAVITIVNTPSICSGAAAPAKALSFCCARATSGPVEPAAQDRPDRRRQSRDRGVERRPQGRVGDRAGSEALRRPERAQATARRRPEVAIGRQRPAGRRREAELLLELANRLARLPLAQLRMRRDEAAQRDPPPLHRGPATREIAADGGVARDPLEVQDAGGRQRRRRTRARISPAVQERGVDHVCRCSSARGRDAAARPPAGAGDRPAAGLRSSLMSAPRWTAVVSRASRFACSRSGNRRCPFGQLARLRPRPGFAHRKRPRRAPPAILAADDQLDLADGAGHRQVVPARVRVDRGSSTDGPSAIVTWGTKTSIAPP